MKRIRLSRFSIVKKLSDFLYNHLKPFENLALLEFSDYKLYVNSNDDFGRSMIMGEVWEPYFTKQLKKHIKKGMIVIDLGAFIGLHTIYVAKLVGQNGKVFAFEPDPFNFHLLLKNIEVNGLKNVIPIQKAVSDKVGQTKLYVDKRIPYRHSIYNFKEKRDYDEIEIEITTLDDFFKNLNIKIDIIKMDIEGAEMAALKGMRNILMKNKKIKIFTEFDLEHFERARVLPEDFLKELTNYGFKIFDINEKSQKLIPFTINNWKNIMKGRTSTNLFCSRE